MKQAMRCAVATVAAAIMATTAQAQVALATLIKQCDQKTIVYGRDEKGAITKVGENIDGYCQGVLEGVFSTLLRAKVICVKNQSTTPEFLLSTLNTYRADTRVTADADASVTLEAAFKRAFNCSEANPKPNDPLGIR